MINLRLILFSAPPLALAHSRWSCPAPRSTSTGIKDGPCGDDFDVFDESTIEIQPGPLQVTFEESVHHTGAPFRISLSSMYIVLPYPIYLLLCIHHFDMLFLSTNAQHISLFKFYQSIISSVNNIITGDGSDDDSCVLLDHIPHNDCCRPILFVPSTYTQYSITIDIPNINCERCSLHLSNPMTDKIGNDGSPSGIGCTDPDGTCFSVYHSCTKPFRIVGNSDAVQRSEYTCPSIESNNQGWPMSWMGDNGEVVDASTPFVYRRESSIWDTEDYTLTTVPEQYRIDTGEKCKDGSQQNIIMKQPTDAPSLSPVTSNPTTTPSKSPASSDPTSFPSSSPVTSEPTANPSLSPVTSGPTPNPSKSPITPEETQSPSSSPVTSEPTSSPSLPAVSSEPTSSPSLSPVTSNPSPTGSPSIKPTVSPSDEVCKI